MIDTHAHLDFPEFDKDREQVISRAFDNGVKKIINIGVDLERSRKSIEIAEKHDGIFASVGIHPDFFSKFAEGSTFGNRKVEPSFFEELKKMAKHKKVVAIGETGLDYFSRTKEPISEKQKEKQKKGFLAQIEIARELNLPVIVHCREAWDDLYEIVSNTNKSPIYKSKSGFSLPANKSPEFLKAGLYDSSKLSFVEFVLHCYSGDKKNTEKFLKFPNVCFSFSANITYPKPKEKAEKLAEAVRMIPLDRIMLDSDSPFLAPQELRGKRNEPIFVKYIAKKIAEIKKISISEVEKITDENAEKFFGI